MFKEFSHESKAGSFIEKVKFLIIFVIYLILLNSCSRFLLILIYFSDLLLDTSFYKVFFYVSLLFELLTLHFIFGIHDIFFISDCVSHSLLLLDINSLSKIFKSFLIDYLEILRIFIELIVEFSDFLKTLRSQFL